MNANIYHLQLKLQGCIIWRTERWFQ